MNTLIKYELLNSITKSFFKINKGYNTQECNVTTNLSNINNEKQFSNAVLLKNRRLVLCPYNYNHILLFNIDDGSIINRYFPIQYNNLNLSTRFVNVHHLDNNRVIFIPSDSNASPFIYDVSTMEYKICKKLQINGEVVVKDIFSTSTIISSNEIFCVNKNTNKCYIYYIDEDCWKGFESDDFIQTKSNSTAIMIDDNNVLLTNRYNIDTNKYCLQIFNIITKKFRQIDIDVSEDEYIGALPDGDIVWLLPYNSNKLMKLDINTLDRIEYELPEKYIDKKITLGGCFLPNGNIFLSPYEISEGLEFNITTKKFIGCPHNESKSSCFTGGALLMSNGRVFTLPLHRKSSIIYGTDVYCSSPEVFFNHISNTTR